jgi:hypothetical protein
MKRFLAFYQWNVIELIKENWLYYYINSKNKKSILDRKLFRIITVY